MKNPVTTELRKHIARIQLCYSSNTCEATQVRPNCNCSAPILPKTCCVNTVRHAQHERLQQKQQECLVRRDSGNGGCCRRHGICISSGASLWLGCHTCFRTHFQCATPQLCPCPFQHQLCRSQLTILHCLLVWSCVALSCTVLCLC